MIVTVILVVLLLLSVAALVWGGLNSSTPGSTPVMIASVVAAFVLACLLGADHKRKIRQRSTAETTGLVIKAREGVDWEGGSSSSFFLVRYNVSGKEYRRKAHTRINSQKELDRYVHKIVKVHYDPNNPKTSWVEIPGVSTW